MGREKVKYFSVSFKRGRSRSLAKITGYNSSDTFTSPGCNCEAAHPACRKRRLVGTHQWQSTLLVGRLPVNNLLSLLVRNGLPFPLA